jgi:hypothetical protein
MPGTLPCPSPARQPGNACAGDARLLAAAQFAAAGNAAALRTSTASPCRLIWTASSASPGARGVDSVTL